MKIWQGYGSEHSHNLVLIGQFTDAAKAEEVASIIARLQEAAAELVETTWDSERDERYPRELRELLDELRVWDLSRAEIEALGYDYSVVRNQAKLTVTGEDAEVQAFVKLILGRSGKIEIYSGHDWTDEGEPRDDAPTEG